MIKEYLKLQGKLLYRQVDDLGVHPIILLVLGSIAFVIVSAFLFYKTDYAGYILIVSYFSFILKLQVPSRRLFLKNVFHTTDFKIIQLIESSILAIPFITILLYYKQYIPLISLLGISLFILFVPWRSSSVFIIPTPFFKHPYEYISGFRKSWIWIGLAYILSIISVVVKNFNLGIFSILLILGISMSYFGMQDKNWVVWLFSKTPVRFLQYKMTIAIKYMSYLLFIPLLIILLGFTHQWYIILSILLLAYLTLSFMILSRYAAFPYEISIPQSIIMVICILILPLQLITTPFFYKKAIRNLTTVLSDGHK